MKIFLPIYLAFSLFVNAQHNSYSDIILSQETIDRLEELIKPFTKYLDEERYIKDEFAEKANPIMNTTIRKYLKENNFYDESNDDEKEIHNIQHFNNKRNIEEDFNTLEQEEIYVTLIGILKKQDERIKELEIILKNK